MALLFTIWDADGTDTLDLSGINRGPGLGQAHTLSLEQGHYSFTADHSVIIGNAYGTDIENLIGTAFADNIFGESVIQRSQWTRR